MTTKSRTVTEMKTIIGIILRLDHQNNVVYRVSDVLTTRFGRARTMSQHCFHLLVFSSDREFMPFREMRIFNTRRTKVRLLDHPSPRPAKLMNYRTTGTNETRTLTRYPVLIKNIQVCGRVRFFFFFI